MVQKIHPLGVIWVPNFSPYVERFQIQKLLSKCSILEPSLYYLVFLPHFLCRRFMVIKPDQRMGQKEVGIWVIKKILDVHFDHYLSLLFESSQLIFFN